MGRSIFQLQIVRAVAALIVVVFHARNELNHRGFADPFPDLTIGAFGVDLFFVVSGFIMVVASERLFGRPGAAGPFLARRVLRIAPLYWAFTAAFALIALRLGHLPGHPRASLAHIVASFLFLPALRPEDGAYFPVYSLGWTLNYEMFFYVCFALTLRLARARAVAALSAALIGLVSVGRLVALPWPLFYWADPIVLEFMFGLWLGLAHRAGWRVPVRAGVALSLTALAGVAAYVPSIDSAQAWRGLAWGCRPRLWSPRRSGWGRRGPAGRPAPSRGSGMPRSRSTSSTRPCSSRSTTSCPGSRTRTASTRSPMRCSSSPPPRPPPWRCSGSSRRPSRGGCRPWSPRRPRAAAGRGGTATRRRDVGNIPTRIESW